MQSFNGAITCSLWKCAGTAWHLFTYILLQWGHNLFVMEMHCRGPAAGRRIHCFNGAITCSLWKSYHSYRLLPLPTVLQWGHNLFVMEIFRPAAPTCKVIVLQWGHNLFVMEIVCCVIHAVLGPRFNGAITCSLWKLETMAYCTEQAYSFNGAITCSLWK